MKFWWLFVFEWNALSDSNEFANCKMKPHNNKREQMLLSNKLKLSHVFAFYDHNLTIESQISSICLIFIANIYISWRIKRFYVTKILKESQS